MRGHRNVECTNRCLLYLERCNKLKIDPPPPPTQHEKEDVTILCLFVSYKIHGKNLKNILGSSLKRILLERANELNLLIKQILGSLTLIYCRGWMLSFSVVHI